MLAFVRVRHRFTIGTPRASVGGVSCQLQKPSGDGRTDDSCRVLVVDDEDHTRVALSLLLAKGGFFPTVVDRGADALRAVFAAAASSRPFELLVLDIQMPGVTGFDVLQELEAHEVTVPTLLISGYRYKEAMEGLDYRGPLEYLEKPFEPDEFLQFLHRLLKAR